MIATIAVITAIVALTAMAEKISLAIVAIDGFHMIAAIATIAEKVNEDRRDLSLTTSFAPFVKFNMAVVNSRFLLGSWYFMLTSVFQRERRQERQRTHIFWVRDIFQKRGILVFCCRERSASWYSYCRYDRCRVVSI